MSRSEKFNLQLGSRAAVAALAIGFVLMIVATQAARARAYKVIYKLADKTEISEGWAHDGWSRKSLRVRVAPPAFVFSPQW